jgi:hypothetical protein
MDDVWRYLTIFTPIISISTLVVLLLHVGLDHRRG